MEMILSSTNQAREEEEQLVLPMGYRFKPTDEELITFYLRNKVLRNPLPYQLITEPQVYEIEPWKLTVVAANNAYIRGEKEVFFFARRTPKYPNGKRPSRSAGGGFWKATTADKKIYSQEGGAEAEIGAKKSLVYYEGKPTEARKTDWIMHEYTLCVDREGSLKEFDQWAICRMMCGKNNSKIMKSENKYMLEVQSNGGRSSCTVPSSTINTVSSPHGAGSSYQAGCSDRMPSPLQSSYPMEIPKKTEGVSQSNPEEDQQNMDELDSFMVDEFLVDDPDLYMTDDKKDKQGSHSKNNDSTSSDVQEKHRKKLKSSVEKSRVFEKK